MRLVVRSLAFLAAGGFVIATSGAGMATVPSPPSPAVIEVHQNIRYGTGNGQPLLLDIYRKAAPGAHPVLIMIHGGDWTNGDKALLAPEARAAARVGFVVFNVNYSLSRRGDPGYPQQLTDLQTALQWVESHAPAYGGSPRQIELFGTSAGGYLAALLGTVADTSQSQPVRAVVSLSGPTDIAGLADDIRRLERGAQCSKQHCSEARGASAELRPLTGCLPQHCASSLLEAASPITHVSPYSPAFLLANSRHEKVPLSQATQMATALHAAGVPVVLSIVPGTAHATGYLPKVANQVIGFLLTHVSYRHASDEVPVAATSTHQSNAKRVGLVLVVLAAGAALWLLLADRRRRHG